MDRKKEMLETVARIWPKMEPRRAAWLAFWWQGYCDLGPGPKAPAGTEWPDCDREHFARVNIPAIPSQGYPPENG